MAVQTGWVNRYRDRGRGPEIRIGNIWHRQVDHACDRPPYTNYLFLKLCPGIYALRCLACHAICSGAKVEI